MWKSIATRELTHFFPQFEVVKPVPVLDNFALSVNSLVKLRDTGAHTALLLCNAQ